MISNKQSLISENFKNRRSFARKFEFLILLGILIEKDFHYFNTRTKLQSFKALEQYLNGEIMTHDE